MTIREQLIAARAAELLTVKEYARIERVSAKTIYRRIWAARQRGAVRSGGQWRIDLTKAMTDRGVDASDVDAPSHLPAPLV
jgi:hypothetical protein